MKQLKAIVKNLKKYRKSGFFRAKFYFTKYYEKCKIDESAIFFESYSANNFSGNVYYIFLEIMQRDELKHFKKYIACRKSNAEKIKIQLNKKGITDFELVDIHSKKYCRKLAECKYLINNSTLPTYFIKKSGQIYLNTWHGTPLKTLGRSIATTPNEIGNTQRNFFMADYLLYPNDFTFKHMKEDYMLDQFFGGKYIIDGYPRNYILFNNEKVNEIKKEYAIEDKEIICYMPTWRGTLDKQSNFEQMVSIYFYLLEIEKRLKDNQILYVNLHNFVKSNIDMANFKKVRLFPEEYETYEFLSIADCLITDYSSVFFDFANSGKKIILFAYDKEEYFENRGTYINMEQLPFPIVKNIDELCEEISNLKDFKEYSDFIHTYCSKDKEKPAKKIVDLLFNGKQDNLKIIDGKSFKNNKKNILIFGGTLAQNGLTTSLRGLLNHVDTNKYNFTLLFYKNKVKKYNYEISNLPKGISYISIQGQKNLTYSESFIQSIFMHSDVNTKFVNDRLSSIYQRELKRIFYNNKFDVAIHFTGYEKQIANLFIEMKNTKRAIYVHNDMRKEKKTKANYHIPSILKAYEQFENIIAIRESMIPEIMELSPRISKEKIKVVHNINNIHTIIENSKKKLKFDDFTESTHTVEEIETILKDKRTKKYIDIARFSPEKGIKRLVEAYVEFYNIHPDTYLFVIGGLGVEYDEILNYVLENKLDHIVVIKSLSNVFPILKECDIFIMSSLYEGLPMSIMEALILDKIVICTDITGPREFLNQGYGYLVEDSKEGVYQGFIDGYEKDLNLKKFDAESFNKKAICEFYDILN